MGVFEGLRAYETDQGPAIFRLPEHTERLFNSAHIFKMPIPFDPATLMQAQKDVVRENNLKSGYIRPIIFYGPEAMGLSAKNLSVHIAIAAWSWGTYLGPDSLLKGIRVKTSSFTRHHVNINMCRAKSVSTYTNSILAHQEVALDGYQEALLLDVDGYVAEGSGENIFVIKNNKLYTPDLTACLEGITRASVIELAGEIGLPIIEKRITRDEVYCADEAFFTGTAAEVTPIRELDNRTIGNGSRGPITERLQTLFFECVSGKSKKHTDWLHYV
jgi:branched-chain amino acid aminotransferase